MPDRQYQCSRPVRVMAAVLTAAIIFFAATAPAYAADELSDYEMLARLVWLEARGESDEGQQAVVAVVYNRLADGHWGHTLEKVIYASGQFSPAHAIPRTTPTEKEYANVRAVLELGDMGAIMPPWVMFFRANYDHQWAGYEHYTVIGVHWFGGFRQDRKAYERAAQEIGEADPLDMNTETTIDNGGEE